MIEKILNICAAMFIGFLAGRIVEQRYGTCEANYQEMKALADQSNAGWKKSNDGWAECLMEKE